MERTYEKSLNPFRCGRKLDIQVGVLSLLLFVKRDLTQFANGDWFEVTHCGPGLISSMEWKTLCIVYSVTNGVLINDN